MTERGEEKELIVWYDCIDDMKAVSSANPDHKLVLSSRNQDETQEWELVVQGGEVLSDQMI